MRKKMAKRRRNARREAARAAIHESGGGAPIVPTRGFHSFVNHNKLNELFDGETARLDRSESPTKRDKKINPSSLLDSWVSCEWRLFFVSCILLFFHILTRTSERASLGASTGRRRHVGDSERGGTCISKSFGHYNDYQPQTLCLPLSVYAPMFFIIIFSPHFFFFLLSFSTMFFLHACNLCLVVAVHRRV